MKTKSWFKKGEAVVAVAVGLLCSGILVKKGIDDLWGKEAKMFVKQLIFHPSQVGAFTPCSKYVAQEVTKHVKKDKKDLRVLEVGAGTGILTEHIVKNLPEGARCDVVEINQDFCKVLHKRFGAHENVTIHAIDILQWYPEAQYDVIVSALPFNIFSEQFIQDIFDKYTQILRPGGRISYVELSGASLRKLLLSPKKKDLLQKKFDLVKSIREQYLDETVTVFCNIPPIYVHHLKVE